MVQSESSTAIPLTRMALLLPYLNACESAGAPVGMLLARAGIPAELLGHSSAAVPLGNAYRFGELACRNLGTEHLGLQIGLARSLDDYGPFGQILQRSLTVQEYLRRAINLYSMVITGQRIWLSEHGEELRFNVATVGGHELAAYQSQIETLVVTINKLREAQPDWSPREISLAYRSSEDLPDVEIFSGSQISRGTGATHFTIPSAMMGLRFPVRAPLTRGDSKAPSWRPLPQNLGDLVQLQIEALLSDRLFKIDTVAEILNMSRRSLQRSLEKQGLTYSQLLTDARIRQAARWLERTDIPIADIAFALGYTDSSNFTRAFRSQLGVSPQTFRDNGRKKKKWNRKGSQLAATV